MRDEHQMSRTSGLRPPNRVLDAPAISGSWPSHFRGSQTEPAVTSFVSGQGLGWESQMYKHAAEAFLAIPDADRVREQVCALSRDYCQNIIAVGADRLLEFVGGRAILRPTDEGLQFRVKATSLITFYAIRTLLQGSVFAIVPTSGDSVEWRRADLPLRSSSTRCLY